MPCNQCSAPARCEEICQRHPAAPTHKCDSCDTWYFEGDVPEQCDSCERGVPVPAGVKEGSNG